MIAALPLEGSVVDDDELLFQHMVSELDILEPAAFVGVHGNSSTKGSWVTLSLPTTMLEGGDLDNGADVISFLETTLQRSTNNFAHPMSNDDMWLESTRSRQFTG